MNDAAANMAKDWLTLALAGIGISFPAHHFLGGLFMAFAGAALAAKWQPEQDRRELWLVMLGAFFAATVMAQAVQAWRPAIPPQLVMAGAGFASRYLIRAVLAMAGMVEARTDTLFDRILDRWLPPKRGGK